MTNLRSTDWRPDFYLQIPSLFLHHSPLSCSRIPEYSKDPYTQGANYLGNAENWEHFTSTQSTLPFVLLLSFLNSKRHCIIFYSQHSLYSQIYCFSMFLFASLYFCMEFLLGISLVFPFVQFGYETCQFSIKFLIVKMSLFLFHFIEIFFFNS